MLRALTLGLILSLTLPAATFAAESSWLQDAMLLIDTRSRASIPDALGRVSRQFSLEDLDTDGVFELKETASFYEENLAFMNTELAPAFEWVTIFQHDGREYVDGTNHFPGFLASRKAHYELWLKLIQNPILLSKDSQGLVEHNKLEFVEIVYDYIYRIEQMLEQK